MIEKYLGYATFSSLRQDLSQPEAQHIEAKEWIQTTLAAKLRKDPTSENQGEIEHILDYLVSDKAPKRLRKMSYDQAKAGAEKWVKALSKKGKDIDDSTGLKGIIRWKKSGMRLVKLVSKEAYDREGNLMAHCVSSYHDKNVQIYSLRDKNNMPHCTMEVSMDGKNVAQIKGKGNGSIHPKYIKYILRALQKFGMEVKEYEMQNLGYIVIEDYEMELLKLLDNPKTLIHKGRTYLHNESK